MNKVIEMGRLTADPSLTVTQGAESYQVARFTLAVDRKVAKGDKKADFMRVIAWNKKAEFCEKYLKKGSKVLVCGRLEQGEYTDKDGRKVYTLDIVAEEIEFADSKKADDVGNANVTVDDAGFMNIPDGVDEELPFG